MKRRTFMTVILLVTLLLAAQTAQSQLPVETGAQKAQRMKWWTDARFGMFIHWGLYALPEWQRQPE
jgi:alpha-L-fucosidase